jgi:hypothetical protein
MQILSGVSVECAGESCVVAKDEHESLGRGPTFGAAAQIIRQGLIIIRILESNTTAKEDYK